MKLWLGLHKWSSLLATLFLLLSCLTGLPLIFGDELSATVAAQPPQSASRGTALALDDIVQRAQGGLERRFVQFVFWQEEAPHRIGLGLAAVPDAPLEDVSRVLVDARSGEPRGDVPPEPRLLASLLELHKELFLGPWGSAVYAVVALLFLASMVSGVVLYGPFMRQLDYGALRHRSRRLYWLDLHNLLGIATAVWALLVGATGLMNTLEGALFATWQATELPTLLATDVGQPASSKAGSLDLAVSRAKHELPRLQLASIGLAGTRYGTPRHHLAWMHGSEPLTRRLFTPVLIDSASGAVVQAKPLPWYLRLLEISRPLHFGDYGGLPLKLLWAGFDVTLIAILSSGLYLWRAKWRTRRLNEA